MISCRGLIPFIPRRTGFTEIIEVSQKFPIFFPAYLFPPFIRFHADGKEQKSQLKAYDELLEMNYFQVMDVDVPVRDEDISDALKKLPERKRMIILSCGWKGEERHLPLCRKMSAKNKTPRRLSRFLTFFI